MSNDLGTLLIEQRELQNAVEVLRGRIAASVSIWQKVCTKLTAAPEKVVFSNAPDGLGDFAGFPPDDCIFVWETVADRITLAQDVKALRDACERLKSIERRL